MKENLRMDRKMAEGSLHTIMVMYMKEVLRMGVEMA
jgi:hypothetical protein